MDEGGSAERDSRVLIVHDARPTTAIPIDGIVVLDKMELRTRTWGSGVPEIVLLHDGLGSISQWRKLPDEIAAQTGTTVLAYDRPGHGASTPVPAGAWPTDWMSEQAGVLALLLEALSIKRPVLMGHSDGGSIALIHAANKPDQVLSVVALAAHTFVETRCTDAIAALHQDSHALIAALDRHHDDAPAVFEAWSGGWLQPGFQDWDIRLLLAEVQCPVLLVQGSEDEYATEAMYHQTLDALASSTLLEGQLLPGLRHGLPRENPDLVLKLVADFLAKVTPTSPSS